MYVCIMFYVCMYVCFMYVCIMYYVCMYVCMYYVCMCVCVCMYVSAYVWVCLCMYCTYAIHIFMYAASVIFCETLLVQFSQDHSLHIKPNSLDRLFDNSQL